MASTMGTCGLFMCSWSQLNQNRNLSGVTKGDWLNRDIVTDLEGFWRCRWEEVIGFVQRRQFSPCSWLFSQILQIPIYEVIGGTQILPCAFFFLLYRKVWHTSLPPAFPSVTSPQTVAAAEPSVRLPASVSLFAKLGSQQAVASAHRHAATTVEFWNQGKDQEERDLF